MHGYQVVVTDELYERDHALALLPMGAGKSVCAGSAMSELIRMNVVNRCLILAPKRVTTDVWPQEFEKWEQLDLDIAVCTGNVEQRMDVIRGNTKFVVMNYENIEWLFFTFGVDLFEEWGFDALIVDESTRMKNASGVRFKALAKYLRRFMFRWALTGSFSTGDLNAIYGQVFIIDQGKRLGKSYSRFRATYFEKTGPMAWQWEARPNALDEILDKISDIAIIIPDYAYADQLPPLIKVPLVAKLPKKVRAQYDELEQEFVEEFDDSEVMVPTAGVLVNKLQQIANGFIYDEQKNPMYLHDAKVDVLSDLVDSRGGEPLLVCYRYQFDLDMIRAAYPDAPHIGSGVTDWAASVYINQWNKGNYPLMLIHPQSAGHGLNLQAGGNAICWYGHTYSLEQFEQTNARLRRQGQDADQVWCYQIVTENTVDDAVLERVADRATLDAAVVAGIKARVG